MTTETSVSRQQTDDNHIVPRGGDAEGRASSGDRRLLERSSALDELRGLIQPAGGTQFGVAVIEGERGIGKTAFLNTVCRTCGLTGLRVLRARGSEQERDRPLGIVHQIVAQLHAASALDDSFRQRLRRVRIEGADRNEHFQLFQEIDEILVGYGATSDVLVAIDDVHLADPVSLDWLHFLSRRIDSRPLSLLMTSLPPQHVLAEQPLDPILAESMPRRIELRPLSSKAVTQLVRGRFGQAAVRMGLDQPCFEVTRGNPSLLFTLFDDLARSDGYPDPERLISRVHDASPRRLVRSIVHRASCISPDALATLQAIALLEGVADVDDIADVVPSDVEQVASTVEQLTAAGILEAGEPLRFVHPIVRSSLLGAIPASDARQLHRRCATVLRRRGAAPSVIAAHYLVTQPTRDDEVARILVAAGRQALFDGDAQLAQRLVQRAESEAPDFRSKPTLLFDIAEIHAHLSTVDVLDLLRAVDDVAPDAAPLLPIVFALADGQDVDVCGLAREILFAHEARGIAAVDLSARTEITRCLVTPPNERTGQPLRPARPDDPPLIRALRASFAVADPRGATAVGLAGVLEHTIRSSDLASDDPVHAHVALRAVVALTRIGRSDLAAALVSDAQERHTELVGDLSAPLLRIQATLATRHGDLDAARHLVDLAEHSGPRVTRGFGALEATWFATLAAMRGKPESARSTLENYEPSPFDEDPFVIPEMLGWMHLIAGHADDAARQFGDASLLAQSCGARNPAVTSWRCGMARALAMTGDLRSAHAHAAEAVESARSFGAPGALAIALGAMAATRPRDRIGLLTEAVRAADRSLDVLLTATTRLELGQLLHREGFDDQAIEVLRRAGDIAHRLGTPALAAEAVSRLRSCGSRPVRLALQGIESLTPAQLRVVQLAASGASNAEIAGTLFISIKTVESHLARAYRKLGIRSRSELAGLLEP